MPIAAGELAVAYGPVELMAPGSDYYHQECFKVIDDIRTYARLQLEITEGMTRAEYVAAVRKYAVEKYSSAAQSIAEQTARHLWDSRR